MALGDGHMAVDETWSSDLAEILADHCAGLKDEDGVSFTTDDIAIALDALLRSVYDEGYESGVEGVEIPDAQPLIDAANKTVDELMTFGHCRWCDSDFGFHPGDCPVDNFRTAVKTFEWQQ